MKLRCTFSFLFILKKIIIVSSFSAGVSVYGQIGYSFYGSKNSYQGSDGVLPFWMYHNQRGRVSEKTSYMGMLGGDLTWHITETSNLTVGTGIFFQDEARKLVWDELFIGYNTPSVAISLGRKQQPTLYNGISASNQNILWSLNARPLPGIQIKTSKPITLVSTWGLGFEAALEEYQMEADRYVSNAKLHHKSFHLVFQPVKNFRFKTGLMHFVQWAGTSGEGEQPNRFSDYIKVFTGQAGGNNATGGDQLNALGNNLGSYEAEVIYRTSGYQFNIFWNSIFEDGSGRRLGNTPDGRYGFFVENLKGNKLVNSLIYELYYTKHQSYTTTGEHKFDNYFNNGGYESGWTYYDTVLGAPFFLENPDGDGIISNRMLVHHLGVEGMASKDVDYAFLISYRKNYGTDGEGLFPGPDNILSSLIALNFEKDWFVCTGKLGADFPAERKPLFGLGISLKINLNGIIPL